MKRSLKNPFLAGMAILFGLILFTVITTLDGPLALILIIIISISILMLLLSMVMSPRLGGIFKNKKNLPDKTFEKLSFSTESAKIPYLKYFSCEKDTKLQKLKTEFKLDEIVKTGKNDFEIVQLIQSWVNSKWEHDGSNRPKINDAFYILKKAEEGERFSCVEYSLVTLECLQALGLIVRKMSIWTKDVSDVNYGGAHVVNEVYLREFDRWIYIDPQFNILITEDGIPLNAVEFQNALVEQRNIKVINSTGNVSPEAYITWIKPYLYYFTTSLNKGDISILDRIFGIKKRITLVPLNGSKPKYFQGLFPTNNCIFTNSTADIYPKSTNC